MRLIFKKILGLQKMILYIVSKNAILRFLVQDIVYLPLYFHYHFFKIVVIILGNLNTKERSHG